MNDEPKKINFYQNEVSFGNHFYGWTYTYLNLIKYLQTLNLKEEIDFHPWIDNIHLDWINDVNKNRFIDSKNRIVCFQHLPYNDKNDQNDFAYFLKVIDKKIIDRIDTLFVLSETNKNKILNDHANFKGKVYFIKLPKTKAFNINFNTSILNEEKIKIMHVGDFKRNVSLFDKNFNNDNFEKLMIHKYNENPHFKKITYYKHLSDSDYIRLITNCVIFNNIEAASANNLIVECVSYNIPIIINKLDPIVNYLGNDYPLYYNNKEELNLMCEDINKLKEKILKANIYLKNLDKTDISLDYFNDNIKNIIINKYA